MNPRVDWFFEKDTPWQQEYIKLRTLVLDSGLIEELKWGVPCYTYQKHNVVLIHGFKNYCALLFPKGVLLQDTKSILIKQTETVQAGRQIRFEKVAQIIDLEEIIQTYIYEAIEIEKAGLKVELKKTAEFSIPEEFQIKLDNHHKLRAAFEGLTPGRQRGYLLYFAQAKQSKTRESRIEKYMEKILSGKGFDD